MRDVSLQPQTNREVSNLLGQARLSDTNPASVYAPANKITGVVKMIRIVNTTSSAATYRMFHDKNGTTYDETTALEWDKSIAANSSEQIDCFIAVKSSGNLAFRSGTSNALTYSVYGVEVS